MGPMNSIPTPGVTWQTSICVCQLDWLHVRNRSCFYAREIIRMLFDWLVTGQVPSRSDSFRWPPGWCPPRSF